jgi:hypothetical protein
MKFSDSQLFLHKCDFFLVVLLLSEGLLFYCWQMANCDLIGLMFRHWLLNFHGCSLAMCLYQKILNPIL